MNSPRKILLIDKASDRKERINALKNRGYAVFPALRMGEARSRCLRGGYDLIVVNAGEDLDQSLQFCDELRKQCPKQLVRMSANANVERDYIIPAELSALLEAVDRLLGEGASSSDYASAA
jgi:DNA-binding response OmpR family regulator